MQGYPATSQLIQAGHVVGNSIADGLRVAFNPSGQFGHFGFNDGMAAGLELSFQAFQGFVVARPRGGHEDGHHTAAHCLYLSHGSSGRGIGVRTGFHIFQCPGKSFHAASLADGRFGRSVQQFIVYRFSGRNVQSEGIFFDGGKFFHRAADIQFRQVTGLAHDGIVQYDGGP